MTFREALELANEDDKIARKSWDNKEKYIDLSGNEAIINAWEIKMEDALADDWEIVEDEICEECRIPQPGEKK